VSPMKASTISLQIGFMLFPFVPTMYSTRQGTTDTYGSVEPLFAPRARLKLLTCVLLVQSEKEV
jgi:hypothetical protein